MTRRLEKGLLVVIEGIDGAGKTTQCRLLEEWQPEAPLVIATGGLASVIAPHCSTVQEVYPYLTLYGLICADEHLRSAGEGGTSLGGDR